MVLVRIKSRSVVLAGVAFILGSNDRVGVAAFSASSSARAGATSAGTRNGRCNSIPVLFSNKIQHDQSSIDGPLSYEMKLPAAAESVSESKRVRNTKQTTTTTLAVSLAIAMATATITLPILPANAYDSTDYASETVTTAIKDLKDARGNADKTFKIYESIAGIITEGKGVGGQINYKGIELDRGYVADEDTSIYNPGLSLLTESEKERLVEGVIDTRKAGLKQKKQWTEQNEYAYTFLRSKLDPYHMVELRGFLGIVPYYGAGVYIAVLGVQQLFREKFQVAYLVGVAAFLVPIVGLVLAGP